MPVQTRSQTRNSASEQLSSSNKKVAKKAVKNPSAITAIKDKYEIMTLQKRIEFVKSKIPNLVRQGVEIITEKELNSRGLEHNYNKTKFVARPYEVKVSSYDIKLNDLYIVAPAGCWWVHCSERLGSYGYDEWIELHNIGNYGEK